MASDKETKETKEKTKNYKLIIRRIGFIIICIIIIYLLFFTGVVKITFKTNKPNTPTIPTTTEENQEEKETLQVTDNTVTTLYKNIELGRNYNALRHYYFYSYDKILVEYMDEVFIKEMALSRLTLTDDTTSVDANLLEKQYKNIVGNNTTYKNRTFQTQCADFKFDSSTASYSISKDTTCKKVIESNEGYFDKITEAYKYNDRIEIIARVGYYEEEKELVGDGIYQSTGKIKVKKNMDTNEVIQTFTENLEQIKEIIDYNSLTKYKYTFTLDNTNYYFYSVEVVE